MLSYGDIGGIFLDPIVQTGVLAVIGALVTRILLRKHPTHRLVGQLVFFMALTALLLYHDIVPYEPGPANASIRQTSAGIPINIPAGTACIDAVNLLTVGATAVRGSSGSSAIVLSS